MEERGAENRSNAMARLEAWQKRGCPEIDDLAEFHQEANMGHLFDAKAPIQPTWRWLITVLLRHQGKEVTSESIRHYQVNELARQGKETCLLELLPLPAPGAGNSPRPYGHWTKQAPFHRAPSLLKREDGKPTKWGTWSVLFRRDIVPPDTFSAASDTDITNALTEFWGAFVNDYLPQIDKGAQQLLKK